jgi:hypothetical protein
MRVRAGGLRGRDRHAILVRISLFASDDALLEN